MTPTDLPRPSSLASIGLAAAVALGPSAMLSAQTVDTVPFENTVVSVGEYSRIDALADLDRDGDLDGVGFFTDRSDPEVGVFSWYRNLGAGRFERLDLRSVPIPRNFSGVPVVAGDFDGDGHDDAVLVHRDGVHAVLSRPTSPVQVTLNALAADREPSEALAADLDGDRVDDLVIRIGASTRILFGRFVQQLDTELTGKMASLDREGDGREELAMLRPDGSILLLGLTAEGLLSQVDSFSHGIADPEHLAGGDLDGDGRGEVVLFGMTRHEIFRVADAGGSLQSLGTQLGGPASDLADVNGDGYLDGICCGGGGVSIVRNRGRATFHYAPFDPETFTFTPARTMGNIGARHVAGAADMDGDGRVDLVAGRGVWFNRAGLQGVEPTASEGSVVCTDFDGDGDVDLNPGAGAMVRNRGDGRFEAQGLRMPDAPEGRQWRGSGYVGDFDGDGVPDLMVATTVAGGDAEPRVRFLRNSGGGHLVDMGPATEANTLLHARHIGDGVRYSDPDYEVVDLDGDGDQDLIAVTAGYNASPFQFAPTSRVFRNDGQGRLELVDTLQGRVEPAGDLDGDGVQELGRHEEPYPYGNGRTIYRVQPYDAAGDSWATPSLWGFTTYSDVSVADLDGDGHLDYLGVAPEGGRLVPKVLFKNPAGDEVLPIGGPVLEVPQGTVDQRYRTRIADLNGDGRPDLLVATEEESFGTWIAMGIGDSGRSFADAIWQVLDLELIDDVDGDGDPDVLGRHLARNLSETRGARLQFGSGTEGTAEVRPVFGAVGPFVAGETVELHLGGARGGSVGAWYLGGAPADFSPLGLQFHIWPLVLTPHPFVLEGAAGAPGAGSMVQQVPVPSELAGELFWLQAYVADPEGGFLGVSSSNGLAIQIGG